MTTRPVASGALASGRPSTPERAIGFVVGASGPVVRAGGLVGVAVGEVVRVGHRRLVGEVIRLDGDEATVQVYEESAGLSLDDPVVPTGAPLQAWLGPGLLGSTFDGLQRPLDRLAAAGTWVLEPGQGVETEGGKAPDQRERASEALDGSRRWAFRPGRAKGDLVAPGDVLGTIDEGPIRHHILVPPDSPGGRIVELVEGPMTITDRVAILDTPAGQSPIPLAAPWPVRAARPVARRLPVERPLVTGQRVIDMLFPVAEGGTAVIPGGFGTGKTVVEQVLARWSDADVVVYVGCGERGNEMAELLDSFPTLTDPRTGRSLMERTVLIANTSNMPVAAREASVQVGMTIAEYFRDQGYGVALLADSTSRWAEALREISGRLEELPGEEGFPAYLGSRLAGFYERAGRAVALGSPERVGSVTLVGAVSPPGGDFSEPVTQASLRLAGTFWALDADLAHARHFPAIEWGRSYSLSVEALEPWYARSVDASWSDRRADALALLARERQLLDIVQLVGADALPDTDRVILEVARLLREVFLQQHAFDPIDAARPPTIQFALLGAVLAARDGLLAAMEGGATLDEALAAAELAELRRAKTWAGDDLAQRLDGLARRVARLEPVAHRTVGASIGSDGEAPDGGAPGGAPEAATSPAPGGEAPGGEAPGGEALP
jgi:V/A-type H+-transporting ATPase subunit A